MPLTPTYLHRHKTAHAHPHLTINGCHLKWYDLDEPELAVSAHTRSLAKTACVLIPAHTDIAGFVILHRCSADFHFLLTALWRGNNELWQAVHYIDAKTPSFAPFPAAYPSLGTARPTFCVWEMGIVAHEAHAWQRYLFSDRSPSAFRIWQDAVLTGAV